MIYTMTTTRGNRYWLDEEGRVTARSNGPKGWNYSGKWQIIGFAKRAHSHHIISLEEAVSGKDIGQGWIHDLDHGTRRMWGTDRMKTLVKATEGN